jgi:hypothetical protein
MSRLVEGEDFYYNDFGYMVLTEKFHLAKGFCCGNGCKHCPYDHINVPKPSDTAINFEVIKDSIRKAND